MKKLISWIEIPATDMDRAVSFYQNILDIDLDVSDHCEEKMACLPNGEGAISLSPGFKPSSDGVLVSFDVGANLDRVISLVSENHGKLLQVKTKIAVSDRGNFALVIDSEGNKIGLYGS